MSLNIFERASRKKLRIETQLGLIAIEQLWDLPLKTGKVNLNNIAVALNEKLESAPRTSFVDDEVQLSQAASDDKLRFDIVLHVIKVRRDQAEENTKRAAESSQRERINKLIEEKELDNLKNKSVDELKALLNEAPATSK